MTDTRCHCGKPLHYNDKGIQKIVQDLVDTLGEYVIVHNGEGKKYRVQRHYVALHGLKERELHKLGFEEVK